MHPSRNGFGYASGAGQWPAHDVHATQGLFALGNQAAPQAFYQHQAAPMPQQQFEKAVTATITESLVSSGVSSRIAKYPNAAKGSGLHIGAPLKRPRGRSPTKVYTRGRTNKTKGRFCRVCGMMDSLQWRRGPDGNLSLCNACGLHFLTILRREGKITPKIPKRICIFDLLAGSRPCLSSTEADPNAVVKPSKSGRGAGKKPTATSGLATCSAKGEEPRRTAPPRRASAARSYSSDSDGNNPSDDEEDIILSLPSDESSPSSPPSSS